MVNARRTELNVPAQNGAGSPPTAAALGLRDVMLLGSREPDVARIATALHQLGANVRLIDYEDPALRARLLGPRPDFVLVDAGTAGAERAARAALETVIDNLRALAVPVLAALGGAGAPPVELALQVDDILLPPFDAAEALLRAAIVVRRRGAATHLVAAGALTVDVEGFRAWLSGVPINLTYTEFQLLRLLLLNRGKVLTRQTLLNKIWGYDYLGGLRTVDVHIRRLRAKIEGAAPDLVETVRHVGYRIRE